MQNNNFIMLMNSVGEEFGQSAAETASTMDMVRVFSVMLGDSFGSHESWESMERLINIHAALLTVEIKTWSVGVAVLQVYVGFKGQHLEHWQGLWWTRCGSFTSSVLSVERSWWMKIGEFPVSLALLTEIDLSQSDDPAVIREDSFVFLEKDVSVIILKNIMSASFSSVVYALTCGTNVWPVTSTF